MEGIFRSVWRFFYFAFSIMFSIAGFAWAVVIGKPKVLAGIRTRRKWLEHVPARLGIQMQLQGTPYPGPCLYVGNHVSYIDPIAVMLYVDANVVAKAEVSRWPLVGLGALIVGTIFVKREDQTSRQETALAIREALKNGVSILVFPEGTTSAEPQTLPFKPRSFEAAYLAGVPVQPIALSFESPKVYYIGDHTFLPHFFRLFTLKYIKGTIVFGPLLNSKNSCEEAKRWIDETLSLIMKPVPNERP